MGQEIVAGSMVKNAIAKLNESTQVLTKKIIGLTKVLLALTVLLVILNVILVIPIVERFFK